jgi:hypothetical protein
MAVDPHASDPQPTDSQSSAPPSTDAPCTVSWEDPDADLGGTGCIPNRTASKKDIVAYLQSHGLRFGQRLTHDQCRIDPAHQSHDNPVAILPGGYYCFSCRGRLGNGFTPWSSIIGTSTTGSKVGIDLLSAARSFAPFSHVRYVLRALLTSESTMDDTKLDALCQRVYAALIKHAHPGVDVVRCDIWQRVFRHLPFVRSGGFWLHEATLMPVGRNIHRKTFEAFSSCQIRIGQPTASGLQDTATDPIRVEQHGQDGDVPGLSPILPIRGAPVFFVKNRASDLDIVRVAARSGPDRVRYLQPGRRMSPNEYTAVVTSVYQGFDLRYYRLLVAAKGVAECGFGPLAEVFSHGVSGSQKTGGIRVAASSLGDLVFDLTTQKPDNFGEAIGSGSRGASFVINDEVFKQVGTFSTSSLRPILLSLSRSYDFRKLNVGSISVPMTSAIVLCDTEMPDDLRDDEQFGRRYIYNPMTDRVPDWRETRIDWSEFWRHDDAHRHAFCSIYSDFVDEYFYEGSRLGFHEIAKELGYTTLDKHRQTSEDGAHVLERMRDVFWAVLHPGDTLSEDDHQGRGWRLLPGEGETGNRITQALEALAVQCGVGKSGSINHLKKQDGRWRELVGAQHGARCEEKHHRGKRYIRFCNGATKGLLVNEELVSREHLLARFPDLQEPGAACA